MKKIIKNSKGHVLIGVFFMVALSLVTASGLLTSSSINIKTRATVNKQTDYYYDAETVLNNVVAWLQAHSKSLVYPFQPDQFAASFDLGAPAIGNNEGAFFNTPTLVKMKNSNNSVILSTDDDFGIPSFPSTQHISSGTSFDAVSEFRNADFGGNSNARVVLIWARFTDGHYEPIYRIDVITGNNPDRGVHSFSYVYTALAVSDMDGGFYGRDSFSTGSPNNNCSSYMYMHDGASWIRGAARGNCSVASNGPIKLKSVINGSAATLQENGIDYLPPSGSVVPPNNVCSGPGCHTISMPSFETWEDHCGGSNKGDLTVTSTNYGLNPSDSTPTEYCWRDITINPNRSMILSTTDDISVYRIRNLDIANNGRIFFPNLEPGKKITLYVENFNGGEVYGKKGFNTKKVAHQLEVKIKGGGGIKL